MRQKLFTNSQVLDALFNRADYFTRNGHLATAQNYRSTAHSFEKFLTSRCSADTVFSTLTVQDYTRHLTMERMVRRNTLSFYLRFLRATYVSMGGSTDLFADAFTSVEPTRKRALSGKALKALGDLSLSGSMAMWRDMFLFSFEARGMAFVDMTLLKKIDIRNGYILYRRHKTGTPLSVMVESCMEEIMNRWSEPESIFVFPIIKTPEDQIKRFREYQSALNAYNKALRTLAAQVGLPGLSSYSARHTWATSAYNAGIPVSVISEGMGHSTEKVTRIYLNQMDNAIIDQANRTLLRSIGLIHPNHKSTPRH